MGLFFFLKRFRRVPFVRGVLVSACLTLSQCQNRGGPLDVINDPGAGEPVRLDLSGPTTVYPGECTGLFTVTTVDVAGTATPVKTDTTINLAGAGFGAFYTDAACSTAISTVLITTDSLFQNVHFKDPTSESLILTASESKGLLVSGTLPITVSQSVYLSISDGPTYDFGSRYVGTRAEKTFTVTNTGKNTATAMGPGTPALAAPFSFKNGSYPGTGSCATTMPGDGSTCTIVVTFQPTAMTNYSDTIRVNYSDASGTVSAIRAIKGAGVNSGALDNGWSSDGIQTTPFGTGDDRAHDVAMQSDGKIVVVGASFSASTGHDFALARYKSDGTLDLSFGTGGKVTTAMSPGADHALSVKIQSDGRIVVAGYSHNGSNNDFAVARYTPSGVLDTTFGINGWARTAINTKDDYAWDLAIQPDGKIIVAGYSNKSSKDNFAMVRYHTDGLLDASFGTSGKVTTTIGTSSSYAYSVALQSDGKILLAGYSTGSNQDFTIVRYQTNGSSDVSFGAGGVVTTDFNSNIDRAYRMAIEPDGKIVLAGTTFTGSYNDFALARYSSNGSLDISFGTGGKITTAVGSNYDEIHGLSIQGDGKIVAAGHVYDTGFVSDFGLVRYESDGQLDTSFGVAGKITTALGPSIDRAEACLIESDGKIVVVGDSSNGFNLDFGIARYWP